MKKYDAEEFLDSMLLDEKIVEFENNNLLNDFKKNLDTNHIDCCKYHIYCSMAKEEWEDYDGSFFKLKSIFEFNDYLEFVDERLLRLINEKFKDVR